MASSPAEASGASADASVEAGVAASDVDSAGSELLTWTSPRSFSFFLSSKRACSFLADSKSAGASGGGFLYTYLRVDPELGMPVESITSSGSTLNMSPGLSRYPGYLICSHHY